MENGFIGKGLRSHRAGRGFTLVELLIVVAIIGLLAAIAIPVYARMLERSRRNAFAADARTVFTAFKRYYIDHSGYPPETVFDKSTLEPLVSDGYLSASAAEGFLEKQRTDGLRFYAAPDIGSVDAALLVLLWPAYDDKEIAYILDFAVHAAKYDGVYFYHDGRIVPVDQVKP